MTQAIDRSAAPLPTLVNVKLKNIEWARELREQGVSAETSFFNSPEIRGNSRRIAQIVYPAPHGTYLVTSEPVRLMPFRAYTLWFCRTTGEIIRLSEPGEFSTRATAHRHVKEMCESDWATRAHMIQRARDNLLRDVRASQTAAPLKYEPGKFNTSGEAAIYSPEYLAAKYGRDTA